MKADRKVLTLAATAIRAVAALTIQKLVAIIAGPAGVTIMAQGQNLIAIATALPLDGLVRGVVQQAGLSAEGREDAPRQRQYLAEAAPWVTLAGIGCALLLLVWSYIQGLSSPLPAGAERPVGFGLSPMVLYLAVAAGLVVPGQYWLACRQATGRYKAAVWGLALTSLFGVAAAALVLLLASDQSLLKAIPMAAAAAVLPLGIYGLLAQRSLRRMATHIAVHPFDWRGLWRGALPLILFAAGSLAAGRLADYYVRSWAIVSYGREAVGQWQAAARLGEMLAIPVTAIFSGVFFPRATLLQQDVQHLRHYTLKQCLQTLAWAAFAVGLIAALAEPLVALLYADGFDLAAIYFLPQAPGEVLRLASLPLTFGLMASGHARVALWLEFASLGAYLIALWTLSTKLGLLALPIAFTARYLIFFFLSLGAWRNKSAVINH